MSDLFFHYDPLWWCGGSDGNITLKEENQVSDTELETVLVLVTVEEITAVSVSVLETWFPVSIPNRHNRGQSWSQNVFCRFTNVAWLSEGSNAAIILPTWASLHWVESKTYLVFVFPAACYNVKITQCQIQHKHNLQTHFFVLRNSKEMQIQPHK